MANGTVAIFRRGEDRAWDLSCYHLLDLGQQPHHSIRCLSVVRQDIWCGFRNKIHVLDLTTLMVKVSHAILQMINVNLTCFGGHGSFLILI